MEEQAIETTVFEAATGDFSVWGMFWQADWVVQLVIIALLVASVWSWTIIFGKFKHIRAIKKKADEFEETFWSGNSLEDVVEKIGNAPDNPLAVVFFGCHGGMEKICWQPDLNQECLWYSGAHQHGHECNDQPRNDQN